MKIPENDKLKEETIRNHINKVKSFVQWIEKRGFFPQGKFSTLFQQQKRTRRPHEAKAIFTPEDLKTIFCHKDYLNFKNPWEFWPPLIALFTGMRINEICQLHLDDIVEEGEIWYISITEGEDKKVKTASSIRDVPLHKELQEIGLPEYVKRLRRKGHKHLFPDRIGHKTEPGKTPGQKINEWIKQIGIKGDEKTGKKTFHSFRHTFASRCKELGLNAEETAEVLGPSEGKGGEMRQIYAKPALIRKLYDDIISKLNYDLDLTHLKEYMEECDYDPWGRRKKQKRALANS
jgi:integrase